MKNIKLLLAAFLLLTVYSNAQNAIVATANVSSQLTHTQKGYLANTWFESPKESIGNTLVFKLTEYVVVVGLDYYNFPPSKLKLNSNKTYNAEYMKEGSAADPKQTEAGKWSVNENILTLTVGTNSVHYTIVSILQDKMILSIN